MFTYKVAWLD